MPQRLLTVEELAQLLGVPVATLYRWRHYGDQGPLAIKVGKHLRYRPEDVEEWCLGLAEREKSRRRMRGQSVDPIPPSSRLMSTPRTRRT
jgi:excisionase family DNA binding protein